jgi:Ca2+/Na+ antiporter
MSQSFGFIDLLVSPVFLNVVLVLFVLSLVLLILNRKKLSPTVRSFWIILLVLCALYLLFFLWAAVMWGQPPAAPPVPAPAV